MKDMPNNSIKRRFVIHKHIKEGETHWDLMIEWGNVLKTWRLDNPPEKSTTEKNKAAPIHDHDKKFLTYQGPVNNGKGNVEMVDEGTCIIKSDDDKIFKINFAGNILNGMIHFNLWYLLLIATHYLK